MSIGTQRVAHEGDFVYATISTGLIDQPMPMDAGQGTSQIVGLRLVSVLDFKRGERKKI